MNLFKYTEAQLRDAVTRSKSLRQALCLLNVAPYGGNYTVLKKAIRHFHIDTAHFTGQAWNKGKKLAARQPLERYLTNTAPIQSYKLKNRLLKEAILVPYCSICRNTTWLDKPIPLELDHVNGNNKDNRLSNLRLLCPNCHATTPTYRGRNRPKA